MKTFTRIALSLTLIAGLAFSGCTTTPATPPRPVAAAPAAVAEPVVALVTAYEPEIEALLLHLQESPEVRMTGRDQVKGVIFHKGTYKGQPFIAFATGISIANAAMSTQIALDHFPVETILFAGIAGGINDKWKTADVVIPERWYYHDESAYFNPDGEGDYIVADYFLETHFYRKNRPHDPHMPDYTNFGVIFPAEVAIIKDGWTERRPTPYFTVDPRLVEAAREAIDSLPAIAVSPERNANIHLGGNGITGSVFLDNAEYRRWARQVWNAEIVDMESTAIAQVAAVNEVPAIFVRSVSDLAGGQKGKNEENLYDRVASRNASAVLFAILDELIED